MLCHLSPPLPLRAVIVKIVLRNLILPMILKIHVICDHLCINRPFTTKYLYPVFLRHPLTELLLTTKMVFFFPHDLMFSSYMTARVIQLKINILRNIRFQFRIRTPFTNSPTTNRFVFNEYIQSSRTELSQEVSSRW